MAKAQSQLHKQVVALYREALVTGKSLDEVAASVDRHVDRLQKTTAIETKQEKDRELQVKRRLPALIRYGALALPILFVSVGMYLIGSALIPIVDYTKASSEFTQNDLVSPVLTTEVLEVTPLAIPEIAGVTTDSAKEITIIDTAFDYTNLANWFGEAGLPELLSEQGESTAEREQKYVINIPKVEVENAVVTVGGTDLNKSLIAYPGTAYPGEFGAPVIFGHSVLRQFYNPSQKNPRRYNSIFSTIMTLEKGDKIFVTHEGVEYTYVVQEKTEVKPEDVYILNQQYDARRLKLVTCTPEGTYLRRGVVTAQLVSGT